MSNEETPAVKADRRYASRKFILACTVWLAGTFVYIVGPHLFFTPAMATDQWITFSQWILGLYVAGNVGDSFVSSK